MTTPARAQGRIRLTLLLATCALLLAGCGAQDLYEPPGAPFVVVGRVPLPSVNEGVTVLGHYAFVAGGQAGLHVIDFADPAQPILVRTLNTTKYAESIDVVRTFANHSLIDVALVVEGTEGITTYDVTDPANVTSFNQGTTAVDGQRLFVLEPDDLEEPFVVFLAESWKGVRIFESNPGFPGLLEYNGVFAGTQGYAKGIAVKDGYAFVADDEMGLAVLDARELALGSVVLVSWADTHGNALDVAIEGDHAYVADGTEGLAIFAIDGPAEPVPVGHLDLSGFSRSVVVRDHLACLAAAGGGVHFVDVRNPAAPVYLGTVVATYASDVALSGDGYILVSDREEGCLVLGGRGPFSDAAPPAPVTYLSATPYSVDAVELSWYATGDDGMHGTASQCDVRRASAPITDETAWEAATPVPGAPTPAAPGTEQSMIVGGLEAGTEYHFAMKIVDEVGRSSRLGNGAAATTFEGIVLLGPTLSPAIGTPATTFTFEVTYRYGTAPTLAEVILDGSEHHAMTLVGGDFNTGALYRYQTTLLEGLHSYAFSFAGEGGAVAQTPSAEGPLVGAAAFTMGSLPTEPGRDQDETPHGVVLSRIVVAAPTEVSQAEWEASGLPNPSRVLGDDLPVHDITWFDAIQYCDSLSIAQGLTPCYAIAGESVIWDRGADGWRLPTEAEWEWLCRAGSETAFANGDITHLECQLDPVLDLVGWYCGNAGISPQPVGLKAANATGLHDMHGNVWEWCWDWYAEYPTEAVLDPEGPPNGFRRVVRGGSWFYFARDCRSASRAAYFPSSADDLVGLRVVRTVVGD